MANHESERGFDRQVAWWAKFGGLVVVVLGAGAGAGALIIPGLFLAAGGFAYEGAKGPQKPKTA